MFGVKAGHLAPEHRLEKRPTEGIDLVQHRFATRANCKTSQRAGPGGRFEDGFAGHISRAHGIDFHLSCERARFAVMNDGHSLAFAAADDANPYPATQQVEFDAGNAAQGALAPMLQLTACLEGDAAARAANTALKRDIVRGQEVLFAFVQSHLDGGAPVALADIDPAMTILGRTGQFYA